MDSVHLAACLRKIFRPSGTSHKLSSMRANLALWVGVQYDEHGSTTALLHLCLRVSERRFLFFFACLGDCEVMVYDSQQCKWRYLVEVKGPGSSSLRLDSAQMPGEHSSPRCVVANAPCNNRSGIAHGQRCSSNGTRDPIFMLLTQERLGRWRPTNTSRPACGAR